MAGVVQDAGVPGAAFDLDQAHPAGPERIYHVGGAEFGICVPASIAARMIEVPSGTVTLWPSMVSVTIFSDWRVASEIDFLDQRHGDLLHSIPRPEGASGPGENLPGNVLALSKTGRA